MKVKGNKTNTHKQHFKIWKVFEAQLLLNSLAKPRIAACGQKF